ncbi:hypothetical protein, partial [Burkholderia latens]|uniref:hypothetical protein n=1 Tax=Burkholderia latens TaxID=488446 RepID=UPI001E60605F
MNAPQVRFSSEKSVTGATASAIDKRRMGTASIAQGKVGQLASRVNLTERAIGTGNTERPGLCPMASFAAQHAFPPPQMQKPPPAWAGVSGLGSLTITYFHTGIRTIIGVESFHGPVR